MHGCLYMQLVLSHGIYAFLYMTSCMACAVKLNCADKPFGTVNFISKHPHFLLLPFLCHSVCSVVSKVLILHSMGIVYFNGHKTNLQILQHYHLSMGITFFSFLLVMFSIEMGYISECFKMPNSFLPLISQFKRVLHQN